MPAVAKCVLCDRPAELPYLYRTVAGQTAGGEAFFIDVPLCLECEERTRRQRTGTKWTSRKGTPDDGVQRR